MTNFTTHSGQIYLNTVPLPPALVDELLTLFANEGAVDLVCALTRARRELRRVECEEGIGT